MRTCSRPPTFRTMPRRRGRGPASSEPGGMVGAAHLGGCDREFAARKGLRRNSTRFPPQLLPAERDLEDPMHHRLRKDSPHPVQQFFPAVLRPVEQFFRRLQQPGLQADPRHPPVQSPTACRAFTTVAPPTTDRSRLEPLTLQERRSPDRLGGDSIGTWPIWGSALRLARTLTPPTGEPGELPSA